MMVMIRNQTIFAISLISYFLFCSFLIYFNQKYEWILLTVIDRTIYIINYLTWLILYSVLHLFLYFFFTCQYICMCVRIKLFFTFFVFLFCFFFQKVYSQLSCQHFNFVVLNFVCIVVFLLFSICLYILKEKEEIIISTCDFR